ncbi:MAG: hypothetical protein Q7K57_46975 [Burkholderiaceae bacterium]|nr:hypothetical protein [Burkholderiaceae bacterium]
MIEAVTEFASRAAEKLGKQNGLAGQNHVNEEINASAHALGSSEYFTLNSPSIHSL